MVKNTIKNNSKKRIKINPKKGMEKNKEVRLAKNTNLHTPIRKPIFIKNTTKQSEEIAEIKSLKQMENRIIEKYEEHKIEPENKVINEDDDIQSVIQEIISERAEKKQDNKKIKETKDTSEYKSRVEAILFAVGKYLDEESISQLCDIEKKSLKKILESLREEYDKRDTALMIVQEGNSWKINVREKYLSMVRKIVADTELSKSVMETLAVIAWKTPVYQNEVVKIRGNKCYDHIEELVNAGFVTKDKKGRSYVLKTTEKFYNYFDIDKKNLQGVLNEAKNPAKQLTLETLNSNEPEKIEREEYSREKLIQALETIETKSITQSDEEKRLQSEFLENIHAKIEESSKRTDGVIAEIPKPMHQQEQYANQDGYNIHKSHHEQEVSENIQASASSDDEAIVIDTGTGNGINQFQKPEEQPQKVKQFTKKQLEKKFKEELQRVKDKTEQKTS
jgi:segregation and condensation protein B